MRQERLAAIQGLDGGEAIGILVDSVGELQEKARALGGRRARPGLERLVGGRDRRLHLGGARFGHLGDRLVGPGIEDRVGFSGAGNELRADQHFRVEH